MSPQEPPIGGHGAARDQMIGRQNQGALIVTASDALGGHDRRERLAKRFEFGSRLRAGVCARSAR